MKEIEWYQETEEVPIAIMVTFSDKVAFEPRSEG
jgi:hypothetical protein